MSRQYLGLDIGTKRIGVAVADDVVKIAVPLETLEMDESTIRASIARLVTQHDIETIVLGYPRNQSGEATKQTEYVEKIAGLLKDIDAAIVFQDESLSSVTAEHRLASRTKQYSKADIDAEAAAIILQDYLEIHL